MHKSLVHLSACLPAYLVYGELLKPLLFLLSHKKKEPLAKDFSGCIKEEFQTAKRLAHPGHQKLTTFCTVWSAVTGWPLRLVLRRRQAQRDQDVAPASMNRNQYRMALVLHQLGKKCRRTSVSCSKSASASSVFHPHSIFQAEVQEIWSQQQFCPERDSQQAE